jgi:hypothetical protein
MTTYVCDLCGFQSEERAALLSHLRDEHQVEDAGPVGSLEQDDGLLILRSGDQVTTIDLDAWQGAQLTARTTATVDTLTLTTDHAASSYGRPVAVIDGEAYGPADQLPNGQTAAEVVRDMTARFVVLTVGGAAKREAELETVLRDLWAGAFIGDDGAGFVNVSPEVTARVVAALRG